MPQIWSVLLLRGVIAVLFGIIVILEPGISFATGLFSLVVLFGINLLVDGVANIYTSIRQRSQIENWFLTTLGGAISVIAGVMLIGNPVFWSAAGTFTLVVMVNVIAVWSILNGIAQIFNAIRERDQIDNEFQLMAGGAIAILFGIILWRIPPAAELRVFVLLIGLYALMSGITSIGQALRLRKHAEASA
ncbi:MAG: DUF308 domain-containing protein [Anaerolineaceae bacterium]|nr:DUF308 domain-containing protein [Anaerolineaceae bacterium]MCY3934606.1 DUF308 domain-containing protein [Chloroflexota bacterium]MCY4009528.1 DUF308 domain-containing protein [Anaerolineaceae bacterium]MCY4105205.1 DUF308 domain-containing protein [Chloroflexota bacterium]